MVTQRIYIVILILRLIQYLHLMFSEVTWVLVPSAKPQIILDPYYLLEYLFDSYDHGNIVNGIVALGTHCIVEVTLSVDHVLKFFPFVYNYHTGDGRVEMENKLLK